MKHPAVSLRGLLLRYLLSTAALGAALVLVWWLVFGILFNMGFILPASAAAEACNRAAEVLPAMTADTFDASRLDPLCRYALFPAPGSPAVLATNMTDRQLDTALNAWFGGSGNLGYTQYHLPVTLADGSVCFLQYDYSVPYANEHLRQRLPDFQLTYLGLLAVLMGVLIWCNTRRTARRLSAAAARLQDACTRITAGDLSGDTFGRTRIWELDEALDTMQTLREHLAQSLREQWEAEQQRAEQIAALSHDLKTPLTVIAGHADLLAEEALPPQAAGSVAAVRRSCETAARYLADLRAVAAPGTGTDEARQRVAAADFLARRKETGRALCTAAGRTFRLVNALPDGSALDIQPHRMARAVDNLLDNAVRFAPPGGTVTLEVRLTGGTLMLAVRDTGPGFSPEALRKAGRLLYTGDTARHDAHQGLGLYMARQVAAAHGGTLALYNLPQGGGCAEIRLPGSLLLPPQQG